MKRTIILTVLLLLALYIPLSCTRVEPHKAPEAGMQDTRQSEPERRVGPQEAVEPQLVRVEGGTFLMDSNSGDGDEKPARTVTVPSFSIGKYEVTQKEWFEIMGTTIQQQQAGSKWSNLMAVSARQQQPAAGGAILYGEGDNYPMYYVDWLEAVRYCNRRSVKEGLTPAYSISGGGVTCDGDANGYRLPTEAEWEYAAKGGSLDPAAYEYAGSNSVDTVAWYDGNSEKRTHEVGTKAPNSLGLYDMSGNVWEWCWDWYDDAPDRDYRVIRGGSWDDSAGAARSTLRYYNNPSFGNNEVGFRLARNE